MSAGIRQTLSAALLLLAFGGCAAEGNGFDVTETVPPDQIRTMIAAAEESLRAAETTTAPLADPALSAETELSAAENNDHTSGIVYWSPSGGVWHTDPACTSLKQAKSVLSGSVVDARAAGKARVCKTCGEE